jgi:hypothetical protein
MRPVSVVLAMVAALLLVFFALTAHAGEGLLTILSAADSYDVPAAATLPVVSRAVAVFLAPACT